MVKKSLRKAKWLILIAYMMGLSIGVHLLNLVTIPVLGLIVYFKYFEKVTAKGIIYTLLISGAIVIIVLEGIIPGLPSVAGKIEILFVNSFGLPFGSGVIFFLILFFGGLGYGIYYSIQHNKYVLNTALLSLAFIMIGYSSYTMVVIRSNYNPPIDENNPEEIISFVSYLKREQYGSRPLFKGPYYTAQLQENKKGSPIYMRGEDKYVIKDYKIDQVWDPNHTTILPRMYSSDPNHTKKYLEVTGLKQGEKPSWGDNFYYLVVHQLGYQYMRYFLWNFVGREHDIQGASWVGLNGAFEELPETLKNNKGRNLYYGLPLLIGLLGMFIQYKKDVKLFSATALLFIMTGIAIVLYLNTPPIEPRERDYIYAGSFYMFTIWIGFGVLAIFDSIRKLIKNRMAAVVISSAIGLSVPLLMVSQTWDDHDRSGRYFSVDAAKNYLSSCAPNSIIFTGGDNDTFPLWYAQEVEGFRTDVRVVVLSYYNTDWYIQQSMRQAYESDPLPYTLTAKHYQQGGLNDYLPVYEREELKGNAINAELFLRLVKDNNPGLQIPTPISAYNSVPAKTMFIGGIDTAKVKQQVSPELKDDVVSRMVFNIKGRALEKKDLAILDVLVANKWQRPIYLNNTSIRQINLDLSDYVVQEGMAYRILPIKGGTSTQQEEFPVNTEIMYDNLMNKFTWTNLDDPSVYYTEDYLGFVLNSRSTFNSLARALIGEGKYDKAREVLKRCIEVMPNESLPFDYFNVQQVDLFLKVDEPEIAKNIAELASKDASEWLDYYFSRSGASTIELQKKLLSLNELSRAFRANGDRENAAKYEELFSKYYSILSERNG
jgi:tetratricopeptide (TPR) repeat protein